MSRGIPLKEAAVQCGIPEPELVEYLAKALSKPAEISLELRAMAQRAMENGIKKLEELAKEERINSEVSSYANHDLVAAQTLAKLGFEILKLSVAQNPESRGKTASASIQLDLWDSPGAWDLKKPGSD